MESDAGEEWTLIGEHGAAGSSTLATVLKHRRESLAVEFAGAGQPRRRVLLRVRSAVVGAQAGDADGALWPLGERTWPQGWPMAEGVAVHALGL
ncbi:hypothetical protein ACOZ38_29240 [Sphaerisporangium viridialbum]|uniref:hypothetical protein n=1 Tax=Sphaerisporangium viridialbum TaxID=46189 RepID=UPI003C74ADFA